ncbi:MAG: vitamin K epoxide reductase family protein [Chloroflexota bacterium]|nr:vitamin K epoxide reductase family protein [Chloroflexota bacterium]
MERVAADMEGETWPRRALALAREQAGLTALLLIALAGLGISIYLTIVHYNSKVALVCTTGGVVNCQSVTSSAWSVIPGTTIPITIPGMLWFIGLGALAGVGLWAAARGEDGPPRLRLYTLLWTAPGLLFVLYLLYAEIVLVQRICEWCTVVHLLTLAAFVIALTRWQRRDDPVVPRHASGGAAPATEQRTPARPAGPALSRRARRTLDQRGPGAR